MRISSPRTSVVAARRRIEADVAFEDADRSPVTVVYEADAPLAEALQPRPEVFLLAAFPAAMWQGERRIVVEGALDRTLRAGLEQAGALLGHWYPHCSRPAIEPTQGLRTLTPARPPHVAALCSGGVDALAMLRENLETYPRDHPRAIRTLVFLLGSTTFDHVDGVPSSAHQRANERMARRVERLAQDLDLAFARIGMNAATLYPDAASYLDAGHVAAMIAPLVACDGRVTDALVASSGSSVHHVPHGSHPLLDGLFGTGAVRVLSPQPLLSRHRKIGWIADWEPAFDILCPCHQYPLLPDDRVNCARCEKCIRTMTGLVAHGALERFGAFPGAEVRPDMILGLDVRSRFDFFVDPELLAGLEAVGRHDLAAACRTNNRRARGPRWLHRLRRRRHRRHGGGAAPTSTGRC